MTPAYLDREGAPRLAYQQQPGGGPTVVFLGGFRSDMTGSKASALAQWAAEQGRAFLRFDYRGHGASAGAFADGTIGAWIADALAVIDRLTQGPLVLAGSSMGGWIALCCALARPQRVAGLVGIAAAPDFTEDLIWATLSEGERARLWRAGAITLPSAYDPAGYQITRALIEDGRRHLVLRAPLALACPVALLHGTADAEVPHTLALRLLAHLSAPRATLTLVKDGDHRLSSAADLALLRTAVAAIA